MENILSNNKFQSDGDFDNNEDNMSYNFSGSLNDFHFCLNNELVNNDINQEDYNHIYFINSTPNNFEKNNIQDHNINNNSNSMTNTKPTAKKYPKIVGKIFNIIKVNKKMGRLVKHSRLRFDTVKHNKFSEDNI